MCIICCNLAVTILLIFLWLRVALETSTGNTGSGLKASTSWEDRVTTSCWWSWRTGWARRSTLSTAASIWNPRVRGTDWGWEPTRATPGTRWAATTANNSPLWIETRTPSQVRAFSRGLFVVFGDCVFTLRWPHTRRLSGLNQFLKHGKAQT